VTFPIHYPEFVTAGCLEWKFLLEDDAHKDVVVDSLKFMVEKERLLVFGFVIMANHFHAIWQATAMREPADVQRDLLKYTGQTILNKMRLAESQVIEELLVNLKDRKYQFWERNSLRVPLWSNKVFNQKLEYMHMNPVRAGICSSPEGYKYSSASYYILNDKKWDFLTHADG
jgi:putative transposase